MQFPLLTVRCGLAYGCLILLPWSFLRYIHFADNHEMSQELMPNQSTSTFRYFQDTIEDTRSCLRGLPGRTGRNFTRLVFIGDSRMRQLQVELYEYLHPSAVTPKTGHYDFDFSMPELRFGSHFKWAPLLDTTPVHDYLLQAARHEPNIVFLNSGAWTLMYCAKYQGANVLGTFTRNIRNCLNHYKRSMDNILPYLELFTNHSTVIWTPQNAVQRRLTLKKRFLTAKNSRRLNRIAEATLSNSSAVVWNSYYQIFESFPNDSNDGYHLGKMSLQAARQIIFDHLCNDRSRWKSV